MKDIFASTRLETFSLFKPPRPSLIPVVCRETCCSDEGGRAHKDKVVSRLVVAVQRLPKDKTKETVSSSDSNKGAGEE